MENHIIEKPSHMKKVGQILRLKCPSCGKGNVFYRPKFPFGAPKMRDACENCYSSFDRGPGFFLGAIYISYALAVLEGLLAFFLARQLIFGITDTNLALVTLCSVILCLSWNFRLSRVIWLNTH